MDLDTVGGPKSTIRVAPFAHSLVASMPPSYPSVIEGEKKGMAEAKRKLAAILAADVAGYSRLMADDEQATMDTLNSYRDVFRKHISDHEGRVVDTAGDSVLSVFDSVVEAVQCAVNVQSELAQENGELPEARRMLFRIGVNLGDIIERDDGTIYGDGVNVAARLESLAEASGICLSSSAHEQVEDKTDLTFQDIGEHEVKNIARPVKAFRVAAEYPHSIETDAPLTLPEKPSIAVLAFDNLSGDQEQDYVADGIAEDLITALSRIRWLFVIARNSTFAYKGQSPDVRMVGQELGVRFVLEGSVRKSHNRVRVSAQLIDATTGNHVWAEHFDRELADIFDLQDEVVDIIAAAIEPEVGAFERERARRVAPASLDAWGLYQSGLWHFYRFSKEDNVKSQALLSRAIEIDPGFAAAHAALAYSHFADITLVFTDDPTHSSKAVMHFARTAVDLDGKDASAHHALGRAYFLTGDGESSLAELERAIELNPNYALAHFGLGMTLVGFTERFEDALEEFRIASRLSPHDPVAWAFDSMCAICLVMLEQDAEALKFARKAERHPTEGWARKPLLAAVLALLGRDEEARMVFDRVFDLRPDFSWNLFVRAWPQNTIWRGRMLDGLRKAGMNIPDKYGSAD
jgi:TolB-like protein/class 3 adenylate cyclase